MAPHKTHQFLRASLPFAADDKYEKEKQRFLESSNTVNEINADSVEEKVRKVFHQVNIDLFRSYLSNLSENYEPVKLEDEKQIAWVDNRVRLLEITKWVTDPEENAIDRLTNVYQAFSCTPCNIALIFQRKIGTCRVFFGVSNTSSEESSDIVKDTLLPKAEQVIQGNFPGAQITSHRDSIVDFLNFEGAIPYTAIISNLPGEKSKEYLSQTIEKLFDGICPKSQSEEYTMVLLAEPVADYSKIQEKLCSEYSVLCPYATVQGTKTFSDSFSISASASKGLSAGIHGGFEVFAGINIGGHWDSTLGENRTAGISDGISRTYTDYSIKYILETLEKEMRRFEQCKSTGMWNYAAYAFSKDSTVVDRVAHMYDSLTRGEDSFLSNSAINTWPKSKSECSKVILDYVRMLEHPRFRVTETHDGDNEPLDVMATTMVSTIELAHAMNFPRKSIPGFPVTECAAFGRSISMLDDTENSPKAEVGSIWHMRKSDGAKVNLDINLLTSHVFITGSTGSGKSNTVYQLLDILCSEDSSKHFLVVEPTKGEYKSVFGGREDVSVFGTNYKHTKLLKINPFSFPDGVQLFAHLDRLIEIFNACWPMYAAMPAVLKDAVERAYVDAGWDLNTSENKKYGRMFPTFTDVLRQIDLVMNESDYSGDSKGDYKGALKTRLKSLTNGIYSDVFGCDEIPENKLFDENVIVDLSEIGPETTSLIMGILVLKLQEYRMSSNTMNSNLKHITVLEEAHNLLKHTSTAQTSEESNLVGKSVELITNSIAEMRTYGECFMIVDQAPGALDPAAIRNTNTKIVLRLPDFSDRELVGKSIGLNDYQIIELGKLERGVAAVYQSGWIESVLCKFDRFSKEKALPVISSDYKADKSAAILLNAVLYGSKNSEFASVIKGLKETLIYKSTLPISLKRKIWSICDDKEAVSKEDLAGIAYELLNADMLYGKKDEPTEHEIAQQFRMTLQAHRINDLAMNQFNLNTLIELLTLEHRRRETDCIYRAIMGGVR